METKVYACYNKSEEIRARSSSGGIYYLLAKEVLRKGGEIFAACYDGVNVKHKRIDNEEDLIDSLGSKYMPSDLGDTFAVIRNALIAGRTVLFAGIPCQCGGLLSYLNGENVDCSDLITLDVVCHGIPSKRAWNSYCDSLSDTGFDLVSVNMRDKSSGWKNYSWRLSDTKGRSKTQLHVDNPYMNGYIADLYLRPACNNCRFKGIDRSTDITLGDYWGVNKVQPDMDDDKGTSLVFLHSEAGSELFDAISDSVVCALALVDQAINYNSSIVTSSTASDKRMAFFQRCVEGEDFCKIVKKMIPISYQVKRKIKNMIKKVVRLLQTKSQ